MGNIKIIRTSYAGWDNCLRLTNGTIELILTTDVGPRIMHYGFCGERNELCVWDEHSGLKGGNEWRCYGGSRLWHGPEIGTRCYEPDNDPVDFEQTDSGVILKQKQEQWTNIEKRIQISLEETGSRVRFDYGLTNFSPWMADICIWVLTLMEAGGVCIIPAYRQVKGIAPNSVMPVGAVAFWPYTSLCDPRFRFGERCHILRHDPANKQNFKIGLPIHDGWVGYINDSHLFIKRFPYVAGARYPDYSSQFELYCCERYTEVESLSPMRCLNEGESIEHWEMWELHSGVEMPAGEEEAEQILQSYMTQ